MRFFRNAVAGMMVLGFIAVFSGRALANEGMSAAEKQDHIQTMQQAADELRPTDPQLADKLQKMVDKKKSQS
jgi:hypothetical protein